MTDQWIEYLGKIDLIQWLILLLGVTEVLLARINNILLYPAGIAATVLAIFSLFTVQLYAECLLHLYYVLMSVYGWWYWAPGKGRPTATIGFTTRREWFIAITIIVGGWCLLYLTLVSFTPSTVPAWDAWVTSTAWAGTWLLARRRVENWILLNVSNAFAIPLLLQKELPLFALLTFILFVIACVGYLDWVRMARKEKAEGVPA